MHAFQFLTHSSANGADACRKRKLEEGRQKKLVGKNGNGNGNVNGNTKVAVGDSTSTSTGTGAGAPTRRIVRREGRTDRWPASKVRGAGGLGGAATTTGKSTGGWR